MIERTIDIQAPIETVYQVIRDFSAYPQFLQTTKACRELSPPGDPHPEVEFEIEVIKPIRYRLRFDLEAPKKVLWSFVEGDLMKKNSGGWTLESSGPTSTQARYFIDVEFGWLVPKSLVELVTETQLPETLEAFKDRAEELYRASQKS